MICVQVAVNKKNGWLVSTFNCITYLYLYFSLVSRIQKGNSVSEWAIFSIIVLVLC